MPAFSLRRVDSLFLDSARNDAALTHKRDVQLYIQKSRTKSNFVSLSSKQSLGNLFPFFLQRLPRHQPAGAAIPVRGV